MMCLVRDLEVHTILFELQDREAVSVDSLRHAWQNVVQQRRELRTVFAQGLEVTDIFQVILKKHDALFTHAQYIGENDIAVKVEREPLPILLPGAPMHVAQAYTAEGNPSLFRLCYNNLVIDDDCLVAIQKDLSLAYHALADRESLAVDSLVTQSPKDMEPPDPVLERMRIAEPSILGLGMGATRKTTMEYTNVAVPASLGEALLLQCSNNGVTPINIIQALWLVLLAKYLRLEQPCCMYRIASNGSSSGSNSNSQLARREFLCTSLIMADDRFVNLVKKLRDQTLEAGESHILASLAPMYNGNRVCNSCVCWYGPAIASNKPNRMLRMSPIKARGSEKVSLEHPPAQLVIFD